MATLTSMQIQLVEAYLDLIQQEGIEQVTLQKVADRAGVAFGTVRYNFVREGQPDLMSASTLHVVSLGYEAIESRLQVDRLKKNFNPLHSYVSAMFDWSERSRKEASYLLYFYYRCGTRNTLALSNETLLATARQRILRLMSEAVGLECYARLPQKPELSAGHIHALLLGALVIAGTERRSQAFRDQKKIVVQGVDRVMKSQGPKVKSR